MAMEWRGLTQLDVRGHAQAGAFHPSLPLFAASVGKQIVEFDILTGSKLGSTNIGGSVVRMGYSPAAGHVIVAALEDLTIRSWDQELEHTSILYSPSDRRPDKPPEIHLALSPLRPWAFFAFHRRTSVNVVGTVEGIRPATKLKSEVKKPITALACHHRLPLLFVAHSDGSIRVQNIVSFAPLYNLQLEDPTVKLSGAGAFAFHDTLEHVFVADRSGALLGWDVSVPTKPALIGFLQVSSAPLMALSWVPSLGLLVVLTREGEVSAFNARIHQSPAAQVSYGPFFEKADLSELEMGRVLAQSGGTPVHPLPRVRTLLAHQCLNALTFLFIRDTGAEEETKRRTAHMSKENRRQLLEILQAARGASDPNAQREKLSSLGSSAVMSDQLLQQQLARSQGQSKMTQPSLLDYARKAYLYGDSSAKLLLPFGGASSLPSTLSSLPLIRLERPLEPLNDMPVCVPLHTPTAFFQPTQPIFHYPARTLLIQGTTLLSYSLPTGTVSILKRLPPTTSEGVQRRAKRLVYSQRQLACLAFFSCDTGPDSMYLHRYIDLQEPLGEGMETLTDYSGRDGAFTGRNESKIAVLDSDGYTLTIMGIENPNLPDEEEEAEVDEDEKRKADLRATAGLTGGSGRAALDEDEFADNSGEGGFGSRFDEVHEAALEAGGGGGGAGEEESWPVQFFLETQVQRVFGTPMDDTLLFVCAGSHMRLSKAWVGEGGKPQGDLVEAEGTLFLSTRHAKGRSLKLKPLETVLQVCWQEWPHMPKHPHVAAVLTTSRVLLVDEQLRVLSSTATPFDQDYPPFKSCLWLGPTLLFSTATTVAMLLWDGTVRPLLATDAPSPAILGVLNDRILLASSSDPSLATPFSLSSFSVRPRLIGLLEPLLLGWISLLRAQGPYPWLAKSLLSFISQLVERFDTQRVTPYLVETLSRGPTICCQLALDLAQSGPQFSPELRCLCAMRARDFGAALRILKDQFQRSPEFPVCPPSSPLFARFRELGYLCVAHAQFDKAREVFETIRDQESLYDLFIAHMNPSALRQLSESLSSTAGGDDTNPDLLLASTLLSSPDPELLSHCEHVLKVRSASWAQGQLMTSLAAERLAPKPGAWAGGNWAVQMFEPGQAQKSGPEGATARAAPHPKDGQGKGAEQKVEQEEVAWQVLPQEDVGQQKKSWELGAEVTAYMKTKGGAIPLMSAPESIGVYLGVLRGAGTVVEVVELEVEGEKGGKKAPRKSKATQEEIIAAAVAGFGVAGGAVGADSGSAGSSMRESTGSGAELDSAEEAQRRAEAEFKGGMYGASGFDSDSDEEAEEGDDAVSTVSKFSKLSVKIRERDAGSGLVDINKLREASRALKLGDAPGGLHRPPSKAAAAPGLLQLGWQDFSAPDSGAAAAPAAPSLSQQPPFGGGGAAPLWGAPTALAAGPGVKIGGVPAQAVALGWAAPQLPPAQQPAPAAPPPSAAAAAAASSGFGDSGGFGDETPFVAAAAAAAAAGASIGAPIGAGRTPFLPPPSSQQQQQQQLSSFPPPSFSALPGTSGLQPEKEVEFGGLLSGKAEADKPVGLQPLQLPTQSKAEEERNKDALPIELKGLAESPTMKARRERKEAAAGGGQQGATQERQAAQPQTLDASKVLPGYVPRGAPPSLCFKAAVIHIDDNRLADALSCLDESLLGLAKERSLGADVSSQAKMCAQYKEAVLLLQEIGRLQRSDGSGALAAKLDMARLSRHLATLQLQPKHRISCMRTAIKRNMEVQNYKFAKRMLDILSSKAPPSKQAELTSLSSICIQRGMNDRTIDPSEDATKFCASTLGPLPTIGHDACDICAAKFSSLGNPGCPICGMGTVRRSDVDGGNLFASPF